MADYSLDYHIRHDRDRRSCTISFKAFDTPNSVTVFDVPDPALSESMLLEVRRMCLEYHRLWSFSSPDSDIARINGGALGRIAVDHRTIDLLRAMKRFHETEPLFDFSIGSVSLAWKRAERVPSDEELAQALTHVGVSKLVLEDGAVRKCDEHLVIDVGGAAKGFVADAIAAYLREAGCSCADIDLGGNLLLVGEHPEKRPWRVEVRIPEGIPAERTILNVSDKSVVTSGSYERFVEIDGKRYQHIIDPRTGWPSESEIVSATVVSASSLKADMLATTVCLAGVPGFFELATRHPDCDFVALLPDGATLKSV